jgi:hypothetical protein
MQGDAQDLIGSARPKDVEYVQQIVYIFACYASL